MDTQKSRLWMWIGIIVMVIAIAAIAFFVGRSLPPGPIGSNGPGTAGQPTPLPSPTREDVPADTVVPGATSTNLPPGVAQPENVKLSGDASSPYLKDFHVTVKNDTVSPDNIVTYVRDIVTITFESGDKAYDFIQPDLGLRWQVPAGGSKTMQFQTASTGKFIFYCSSCGGPGKGPVGYIVSAAR